MSLGGICHEILRQTTELQTSVYEYLEFTAGDVESLSKVEKCAKEINRLTRKLRKEDSA